MAIVRAMEITKPPQVGLKLNVKNDKLRISCFSSGNAATEDYEGVACGALDLRYPHDQTCLSSLAQSQTIVEPDIEARIAG